MILEIIIGTLIGHILGGIIIYVVTGDNIWEGLL